MSNSIIRNQRAFLFLIDLDENSTQLFVLGPLQPGEDLKEILIEAHSEGAGRVLVQVGANEEVITDANFDTDVALFTQNGEAFAIRYEGLRARRARLVIPMNRSATDRERYFAVRLDTNSLASVSPVVGSVNFSVTYSPVPTVQD